MISEKYKTIYENAVNYFATIKPNYEISKLMMLVNNETIQDKINVLLNKDLNEKQAIQLLENMPNLLLLDKKALEKDFCTIYNSDILYAVVLLNKNSYEWSYYNLEKEEFQKLRYQAFDYKIRQIDEDSMIRAVIDSTFREDIIKYAKIEKDDNLETRMAKLKNLNANSSGYRIK